MAGSSLQSRKPLNLEAPLPTAGEKTVEDPGPVAKALSNEYILAELFSYLSVKDLKACRFVNHVWNQEATGQLIDKAPVVDLKHPSNRGRDILELLSTSWNFPCRKFAVIYEDHKEIASPGQKAMLARFLETVASFAIHLSVQIESNLLFSRRKPKKSTEYPRLTSLELDFGSGIRRLGTEVESFNKSKNLDFMISILEHAPNLERVSLDFLIYNEEDVIEPTFCDLLKHVPWNQIRHLKLDAILKDLHFQTIVKLGPTMQLKSFDMLCYSDTESNQPNVNEFLKRQSPFLETLTLEYLDLFGPIADFTLLPQFKRLKTLRIEVNFFFYEGEMPMLLVVPSFYQSFPVLEFLSITEVEWFDLQHFLRTQEDGLPVETVKELKLDIRIMSSEYSEWKMTKADAEELARRLSKLFPSVTKLGIPASRKILEAIEEEKVWKDSTELTLFYNPFYKGGHVDRALTGLLPENWDRIREMQPGCPELQQEEMDVERKILKFFHQLEILNVNEPGTSHFSDISCRFVLLKLEKLKSLNTRGAHHQISKEVIREMSAKFEVVY